MNADPVNQQIAYSGAEIACSIRPSSTGKGAVLIVEDERSSGLSLRFLLSDFRLTVIQSIRSEEVVSVLRNAHFDVALLNLNKPGINGTGVCRGIRKDLPRLPILMLAVTDDENQALEAFEAGVDDYIAKPFRSLDLIARLDAAIRRGGLRNGWNPVITVGDVSLDSSRRLATKNGRRLLSNGGTSCETASFQSLLEFSLRSTRRRRSPGALLNFFFIEACETGFNVYFGHQRPMHGAFVRDFQEPLTLRISQIADEQDLSLEPINQPFVASTVEAILGMDPFMRQADSNAFKRPSFLVGVHTHGYAGAGTERREEKFVWIWPRIAATNLDWLVRLESVWTD